MSSLTDLIDLFAKFPSLGQRSARRIVLYLLKNKEQQIPLIIEKLNNVKANLIFCKVCGNIDIQDPCKICGNKERKSEKICIAISCNLTPSLS